MAIFNHKKNCGKAKNYLLKIIGGAKAPPAPTAPRSLELCGEDSITIGGELFLGGNNF